MLRTVPADHTAATEAARIIRNGGIVVFPSDTTYGIACDFSNNAALQRVLDIKQRTDKRFTLIADSVEQVEAVFSLSDRQRAFAKKNWPGPVSLVVSDLFSVRVPHGGEIGRMIAAEVGQPILATSANISGRPTPRTIVGAQEQLGEHAAALWIDAGELPERTPSTIVRITEDGCEIVREGAVPKDQLKMV